MSATDRARRRVRPADGDPRQALTHRIDLSGHPAAAGVAATDPAPASTPSITTCDVRSYRGGSIGPCGALKHADQPCPRRGQHVDVIADGGAEDGQR